MNKDLTYSKFKDLLGKSKRNSDPLFCRYFLRPLSFPIGWIFYSLGIRANSISLISIVVTVIACLLIIFGENQEITLASFLMIFVALLDCVDGNVARARGETGPAGEWMDALSGYTVYALLPISLGIGIQIESQSDDLVGIWIIVGSITVISNLYSRLLYQKYMNSFSEMTTKDEFKGDKSLFAIVSSEIGLVGWMMPTLLFASFVNKVHLYMLFYSFMYVVSALVVALVLVRKVN